MRRNVIGITVAAAFALYLTTATAASRDGVMWSDPGSAASRDLFYGPGGEAHQPHAPFTFIKEDLDGTNPKFVVRDVDGVKWKVKMGLEARPETVATRLVWAVGYYANEDYFLSHIKVDGMPPRLKRGWKLVSPAGEISNVRLKREDAKKADIWQWDQGEFTGTREWNGLRVMMALINNWDLKDENNAIYKVDAERVYMVSDLGASFGSAGRSWPRYRAKDNLDEYAKSRFIKLIHGDLVDFQTPARPRFVYLVNPKEYLSRVHLEHLGKNVPRADAKWIGALLARVPADQFREAFRAGGYTPQETEAFIRILESRIAVLTDL